MSQKWSPMKMEKERIIESEIEDMTSKKNDFFIYPEIQSFESALIFSRNFKNLVAFPSRMYFLWAGGKKIY